jgi:cytochrome c556
MEEAIVKKLLVSLLIPFSLSVAAADFSKEIDARQDAYKTIKDNVGMVGDMFDSGNIDWKKLEVYSKTLADTSALLKDLFPEGSQQGSDAKAAIWKNKDKFNERLGKLNTGFTDLSSATTKQDKGAAMSAFEKATGTCKACHRKFRVKR